MANHHLLLVAYPVQGHLNPALKLAQRLIRMGMKVTFATNLHSLKKSSYIPKGLSFAAIADIPKGFDANHVNALRKHGSKTLIDVIQVSGENGCPVTFVVYTTLLTWAAEVAREWHIPSALLWTQPATVFGIYYHYFHGYEDDIKNSGNDPFWSIQLPGLPSLSRLELPSNILPSSSNTENLVLAMFKQQFETIDAEEKSRVLVNTFDALEDEALEAIEKYKLIAIGPLVSYALLDEENHTKPSFCENYMRWLCSQPRASVVYISFGSVISPSRPQMEKIARALLESGRPFLWVIREMENQEEEGKLSCWEELEQKGMIVPWSSQYEVLRNPSLGCFITHCGWNSTLESIVFGVPLIAFPQWVEQKTNAKLIKDRWKTGVMVRTNKIGEVESDEIKKCIELVMHSGEKGLELRRNVQKWKILAMEASKDGGSLDKNLKSLLAGGLREA